MAFRTKGFMRWQPEGGTRQFLTFDVIETEQQEHTNEITQHAVERGPNVTDHVRRNLDIVTFEAIISNEPLYDTGERGASEKSLLLDIPTFTPPASPTPGALFAAIGGAISSLFSNKPVIKAQVMTFDGDHDMVSETHEILKRLVDTAQLIDVTTTTAEYRDMILQKATMVRNADIGTGGTFSMTFMQIRRVEVKLVTAPVPTIVRAKKAVPKGPQGPTPTPGPKKSVAVFAKNKILGRH